MIVVSQCDNNQTNQQADSKPIESGPWSFVLHLCEFLIENQPVDLVV